MGEAEIITHKNQLIIRSVFFFYGNEANDTLSTQIANDIAHHWNAPNAGIRFKNDLYRVYFDIKGFWAKELTPEIVFENTDPKNNYFRIEAASPMEVSFVDGLGCNTGFFLLKNLLQDSTTAAHEYGHTLGLMHPQILDIRGMGVPGIMYPRGSIVDSIYQYNPAALAGDNTNGGTMNPFTRKVSQPDIDALRLNELRFDNNDSAAVGEFTSVWHEAD